MYLVAGHKMFHSLCPCCCCFSHRSHDGFGTDPPRVVRNGFQLVSRRQLRSVVMGAWSPIEMEVYIFQRALSMDVSENSGLKPPKSSILIGFSIINHPFWGTPIFGNTLFLIVDSFGLSQVEFAEINEMAFQKRLAEPNNTHTPNQY